MSPRPPLAAMLLTGGASRRMGFDKATMVVEGEMCALRTARLLGGIAQIVIEIGPGWTGLTVTREEPPGRGPLAAVAAGVEMLGGLGHLGPALVVACDLPRINREMLTLLSEWPGDRSVIPVVEGRRQPLCARWSAVDLARSIALVAAGESSLRSCPDPETAELIDESGWGAAGDASVLSDADCPDDLDRLGVRWRRGVAPPRAR